MSDALNLRAAELRALEIPPEDAAKLWYQNRGRSFERIISKVLELEGLAPRTSFRPEGEELDGSFVLSDRTFLLEAKWRQKQIPASDLYAFKGKVDGKLVGTLGVFISMSGFSGDAINALKAGKEINLVLFSGEDFRMVARGDLSFTEAMRRKLRYAAEEGQPYLPLAPDEFGQQDAEAGSIRTTKADNKLIWDVVVEGAHDEIGLRKIIERLAPNRSGDVRIWAAGGQLNVSSLVRNLMQTGHTQVAALIDRDDAPVNIIDQLMGDLAPVGGHLILTNPNMEDWLESCCPNDYVLAVPPTAVREKAMRRFSRHADLKEVLSSNENFRRWANVALGVDNNQQ